METYSRARAIAEEIAELRRRHQGPSALTLQLVQQIDLLIGRWEWDAQERRDRLVWPEDIARMASRPDRSRSSTSRLDGSHV